MKRMKKYAIGLATLAVLIVYSFGVRHEQPLITTPASMTAKRSNDSSAATGGGAGTSTASTTQATTGTYKDGTYTGSTENAYYGDVQVSAHISGGKLTDVSFLQYPHTHSTSVYINHQAMPYLKQEAIKAQGSNVDIISGATYTSQAFVQSLRNALSQAT